MSIGKKVPPNKIDQNTARIMDNHLALCFFKVQYAFQLVMNTPRKYNA